MASSTVEVTVKIGDIDRFRLLVWELRQLGDAMLEDGCPHIEPFMNALDRFTAQPLFGDDREEGNPE